jgi:hypothetical protein
MFHIWTALYNYVCLWSWISIIVNLGCLVFPWALAHGNKPSQVDNYWCPSPKMAVDVSLYKKKTKEITGVLCSVLWIVVCTFILFLVAIVFSVPFQLAASDYPFVIFKLFLEYFSMVLSWIIWLINKPCIYCMIILNLQI